MMFDTCLSSETRRRNAVKERSKEPKALKEYLTGLDPKLTRTFFKWALRNPRYLRAYPRLIRAHKECRRTRQEMKEGGLMVPPFLILSITSRCNLTCSGCYSAATGNSHDGRRSLTIDHWRRIIKEASSMGVYSFIIAGGEPFLQPGLVELCGEFKDRIFIIVTNGTTITGKDLKALKRSTNITVLVSLEGGKELTDARRGAGVHDRVMTAIDGLRKVGTPLGVTVTVTRWNYTYWMDHGNIDNIIKKGALVGIFIEYIPVGACNGCGPLLSDGPVGWDLEDDSELVLTTGERAAFRACMLEYRERKPLYLIHSPGDEDKFGGCVSAGRGFAHVTPRGDLTPCPISNIATHNLTSSSLQDGLASPLFERIRESEGLLENEGTPCALFAHPEEVDALAKEVGAYRTDDA